MQPGVGCCKLSRLGGSKLEGKRVKACESGHTQAVVQQVPQVAQTSNPTATSFAVNPACTQPGQRESLLCRLQTVRWRGQPTDCRRPDSDTMLQLCSSCDCMQSTRHTEGACQGLDSRRGSLADGWLLDSGVKR